MSALTEFAVFQVSNYKNQVTGSDEGQFVLLAEDRSGNQQSAGYKGQSKNCGNQNDLLSVLQVAWSNCKNGKSKNKQRNDAVSQFSFEKLQAHEWQNRDEKRHSHAMDQTKRGRRNAEIVQQ